MRSNRRFTRTFALLALVAFVAHAFSLVGVTPGSLPSTGDTVGAFYPWFQFARRALWAHGEMPLWNPHLYCGLPFLGNGQSGLLYPPNYINLLLPQGIALWLFAYGHSLFLMVGCYFLGRTLGLKRRAAFLAAALFGLGNANPAHLYGGHLTFLPARSYWPWEAAFLLRLLNRHGRGNAIYLAACLALGLAAGAPQIWLFGVLFCLAIFLVWAGRAAVGSRKESVKWLSLAGTLALTAFLTALWCAPILLPLRELKAWSSHGDSLSFEQVSGLSATPYSLFRLLFTGFFGGNSFFMWSLPSNPGEDAASLGLAAFILALLAPVLAKKSSVVRWIYAGCLFSIVLALGAATPLYRVLYDHLLFFQITRVPARWLELWAFGASLLAGFAFDALLKKPAQAPALQRCWIGGAALGAVLFLVCVFNQSMWQFGAQVVIHALNMPTDRIPFLAASLHGDALLSCGLGSGTLLILALFWRRGLFKNSTVAPVLGLLLAEPLMQFWLSTRVAPPETVQAVQVPAEILKFYKPGERWIVTAPFGQLNAPMTSGIDALNGYEPFGSAQFFEFARYAQGDAPFTADFQPARMTPMWRVAGVTHLLWKAKMDGLPPSNFRGDDVVVSGTWHLRRLDDSYPLWPRAYLTTRVVPAPTDLRYSYLTGLAFRSRSPALAVQVEPDFPRLSGKGDVPSIVQVQKDEPDVLSWNIRTARDAAFVHQEAIAPGWVVFVDGQRTPLFRANGFFRAVKVPAGARNVAMVYDSQTLRFGFFLALAGLGFAAASLVTSRKLGR